MLTHGNIFANVVQTEAWHGPQVTRGDGRYLLVIPYFHIYAFTVGMMMGIWVGAMQVISEIRRGSGSRRVARLPADLLPRRAHRLRLAAASPERQANTGCRTCGRSTPAAHPVRSK